MKWRLRVWKTGGSFGFEHNLGWLMVEIGLGFDGVWYDGAKFVGDGAT